MGSKSMPVLGFWMPSMVDEKRGRGEEGKGETSGSVLKTNAVFSEIGLALILKASHSDSADI